MSDRGHIHILGICGTFMAGVAQLAREAGYRVSGSDTGAYPPMSTQLAGAGIEVLPGYAAAHLEPAPDWVVIGNALSRGNPEVEAVLARGLDYTSGPEWLARHILHGRHVLAVAGTHGKTTTTSMLAWVLNRAGLDPGFLIGGVTQDFNRSARLGSSPFFVVEADEYDTAFFDKRSKFVHYRPATLVLNNLEYDHADIFPDLASIEKQFHHLVRTVPGNGKLLANARDDNLARVLDQGCWTPVEYFLSPDGWDVEPTDGGFAATFQRSRLGSLHLNMPGEHNRANALVALAAAHHAGVEPALALQALDAFKGVKRRLELRGIEGGVRVLDDFAHHPTAIRASLEGLKAAEAGRVLAVLEPRSNTMRMGMHKEALAGSLRQADAVFIYRAPDLGWNPGDVVPDASVHSDMNALVQDVTASARTGDCIVVMSNGTFGGIHERLLEALGSEG